MREATTILQILTEVTPLVLAVIVLGSVLFLFLWAMFRVLIPAMQQTSSMFAAQRESYEQLFKHQRDFLEAERRDWQSELAEEKHARAEAEAGLRRDIQARENEISALRERVKTLETELVRKNELIADLTAKLAAVERQRNDLQSRIETLEKRAAEIDTGELKKKAAPSAPESAGDKAA
jgi:chromosome segregation ATPase